MPIRRIGGCVTAFGRCARNLRGSDVGAITGEVPVDLHWIMDNDIQISGSAWFTTGQGQELPL